MHTVEIDPRHLVKPVVPVLRAVSILRHLGRAGAPAGVQEIARALDIVPSNCLYILRTLAYEGMVVVDPRSKRYRLGPTLLRLARDMKAGSAFLQAVQPILDSLAEAHGVTTAATWLEGPERVMVVAKSQETADFSINVTVGNRFPALVSAVGLSLAAHGDLDDDELARGFDTLAWQNPPDPAAWRAAIAAARKSGIGIDPGHFIEGVTVFAAPVFDSEHKPTRNLVALGLSGRLAGPGADRLKADLKEAADSLSDLYDGVATSTMPRDQVK